MRDMNLQLPPIIMVENVIQLPSPLLLFSKEDCLVLVPKRSSLTILTSLSVYTGAVEAHEQSPSCSLQHTISLLLNCRNPLLAGGANGCKTSPVGTAAVVYTGRVLVCALHHLPSFRIENGNAVQPAVSTNFAPSGRTLNIKEAGMWSLNFRDIAMLRPIRRRLQAEVQFNREGKRFRVVIERQRMTIK